MGVVGCAWATLGVNTFMCLTGLYLLRTQDIYHPYQLWRKLEAPQWPALWRFLQLGVPAGLSIMVEVTSFTLMALFNISMFGNCTKNGKNEKKYCANLFVKCIF
jgi:MATE family multidrug resistance protein